MTKDTFRLDEKRYQERMERIKVIEQEHNQMMQQKEEQIEQIRAAAHMDRNKAVEDYEQEKEWQEVDFDMLDNFITWNEPPATGWNYEERTQGAAWANGKGN